MFILKEVYYYGSTIIICFITILYSMNNMNNNMNNSMNNNSVSLNLQFGRNSVKLPNDYNLVI